ncbi:hypothetical protein AB0C52_23845 [Streptomyces sp. NPDC048717]|uniref:hypothetical protein n=1 Tax=Streptomyces sp. NPDC048717 TaxID=3154928 RepID=UPI003444B6A5
MVIAESLTGGALPVALSGPEDHRYAHLLDEQTQLIIFEVMTSRPAVLVNTPDFRNTLTTTDVPTLIAPVSELEDAAIATGSDLGQTLLAQIEQPTPAGWSLRALAASGVSRQRREREWNIREIGEAIGQPNLRSLRVLAEKLAALGLVMRRTVSPRPVLYRRPGPPPPGARQEAFTS